MDCNLLLKTLMIISTDDEPSYEVLLLCALQLSEDVRTETQTDSGGGASVNTVNHQKRIKQEEDEDYLRKSDVPSCIN